MAIVIPDTSPADLLKGFRGHVTSSRAGYPDVLHIDIEDADGRVWWFSTFDAAYSPSEPERFIGKVVVDAALDIRSRELTIGFSDGSSLRVVPAPRTAAEPGDLENWSLFTPDGLVLNYGPGDHWVLKRASDPI